MFYYRNEKRMKKICFFILIIFSAIFFTACNQYEGKEIKSIYYKYIDYNGGYTKEQLIKLEANEVLSRGYLPPIDDEVVPEYKVTHIQLITIKFYQIMVGN